MIAVGHASTGVLVGLAAVSVSSALALPLSAYLVWTALAGVGAHYAGDWLPHGHYRVNFKKQRLLTLLKLSIDGLIPVVLFLGLAYAKWGINHEFWLVLTGIVGTLAPDIWENLLDAGLVQPSAFSQQHRRWHYQRLHWHNDAARFSLPNGGRPLVWSDLYLLALFSLSLWLLMS